MSDTTALSVPDPGWYPDRNEANTVRWWDGQQWTDQTQTTAPAEVAFQDPVSVDVFQQPGSVAASTFPAAAAAASATAAYGGAAAIAPVAGAVPPGWYPDNYDASLQRWWDGTAWTAHTSAAAPYQGTATQPGSSGSNALATLAMVLSICSFAGPFFPPLVLLAVVGIVLGIVAVVRAQRYAPERRRRGQGIAAIVVGAVSLVLTVFLTIAAALVYVNLHSTVGSQAAGQQPNPRSGSGTAGDGATSFPSTLSDMKQVIAASIERRDSVSVTSVTCDGAASMVAGSTFDCRATVNDGRWLPARVNILQPAESGMSFDLGYGALLEHDEAATPRQYTLDAIESELRDNLAQAWGSPISKLWCDSNASMSEGSTFQCGINLSDGGVGLVRIDMVAPDGYDASVLRSPLTSGGSDSTDPDLSNS